jgi:glycosyltransferase involved in cell wall biosynthesis
MKILLVVHQYLPRFRGGVEVYTHSLAKALSQQHHEVMVYCREPELEGSPTPFTQESGDSVLVRRVSGWRGKTPPSPWRLFENSYHNPLIENDYARVLNQLQPDLVHIQHLKDLSARIPEFTAQRSIPLVMTLHDYWALCPNAQCVRPGGEICERTHWRYECGWCAVERLHMPRLRPIAPLMAPLFLRRQQYIRARMQYVQCFSAPSEFLRERYISAGYPAERIWPMELGLDLDRLAVARSTPRDAFRAHYAFIGSIAWQKGVHVLVEAFRHLGDTGAQLRIWGSTEAFPEYARACQQKTERCPWITWGGALDPAQVGEALAWADYLIVPSLWWENSPVTIQEAYAAGIPVIASRLGALCEKVQDEHSGLLFTPGSAQDLAGTVRRTLSEPDLWTNLRAGLPAAVSMSEHVQRLQRMYAMVGTSQKGQP